MKNFNVMEARINDEQFNGLDDIDKKIMKKRRELEERQKQYKKSRRWWSFLFS